MDKQKLLSYWDRLWEGIGTLRRRGFFHIIAGSTLAKIAGFVSVFFLPRFLSKADYGLLTYVDNIRNYVMLFNGLGITQATLRYCAPGGQRRGEEGLLYHHPQGRYRSRRGADCGDYGGLPGRPVPL